MLKMEGFKAHEQSERIIYDQNTLPLVLVLVLFSIHTSIIFRRPLFTPIVTAICSGTGTASHLIFPPP